MRDIYYTMVEGVKNVSTVLWWTEWEMYILYYGGGSEEYLLYCGGGRDGSIYCIMVEVVRVVFTGLWLSE